MVLLDLSVVRKNGKVSFVKLVFRVRAPVILSLRCSFLEVTSGSDGVIRWVVIT